MTRAGGPVVLAVVVLLATGCSSSSSSSSSSRRTIEYMALGDSYPSGEGNGPYDPGTDASFFADGCRRSAVAYPRVLRVRDTLRVTHVACSRATISSLTTAQFRGQAPQLDALTPRTGLVTVEIGANDTGAVDMLASCLAAPAACQLLDSTIEARVAALGAPLTEALREAHRRARQARILVVGYPQILPVADCIDGMCVPLVDLHVHQQSPCKRI